MPQITQIDVSAYTVLTDLPESDGTLEWDAITIVIVEAHAGGYTGLGFTYGDIAAGRLIDRKLSKVVLGFDAMATAEIRVEMARRARCQMVRRAGLL